MFEQLQISSYQEICIQHQQQYPVINLSLKSAKQPNFQLAYYGLSERFHEVKEWYDGYIIGTSEVYNPWSIINYTDDISKKDALYPKPYWSNTSSNSIIRELVEKADNIQREEIERLLAGETLEKPVHEDITYEDVYESSDNLWNFLFFTGYLKSCSQRYDGENTFIQIAIPNIEIQTIYRRSILSWFDQKIKLTDLTPLILAIEEGDCENIGNIISEQLMDTISFFDYGEDYYHGFLAGLLKAAGKYRISSNRENGIGRTDITMKTPFIRNGLAVIFELKVVKNFREMEEGCQEALKQVETRQYEAGLRSEGYSRILKYGICFSGKECIVQKG